MDDLLERQRQGDDVAGSGDTTDRRVDVGDNWPMSRPSDDDLDVIRAAHLDRLAAALEPAHTVGRLVAIRVGRIEALDEQVLGIALGGRQPPRDMAVVAQDGERDAGHRRAADRQPWRLDASEIEQVGRAVAEMGVVGEHGFASRGPRTRHGPGVRRRDRAHSLGPAVDERREIILEAFWPIDCRRRHGRRRPATGGRKQLGDAPGIEAFGEPGAQRLGTPVAGQPHGHDA